MKAVVISPFRDKTKDDEYQEVGKIVELTKKRFKEIQAKGNYLKPVDEEEAK